MLLLGTVLVLAGLGAALAIAASLGALGDGFLAWLGAGVLWTAALSVLVTKVIAGSGRAACPSCGAEVGDLRLTGRNDGILCHGCGAFLEGQRGELAASAAARVAAVPLFGATLPESFAWPEGCVVCGQAATRHLQQSVTVPNAAASAAKSIAATAVGAVAGVGVLVRSGTRITLLVPHCSAHDDGALLEDRGGAQPNLVFRSLAYARAFCQLNQVRPAESVVSGRMLGPRAALGALARAANRGRGGSP
jgi:hypothetical protein